LLANYLFLPFPRSASAQRKYFFPVTECQASPVIAGTVGHRDQEFSPGVAKYKIALVAATCARARECSPFAFACGYAAADKPLPSPSLRRNNIWARLSREIIRVIYI